MVQGVHTKGPGLVSGVASQFKSKNPVGNGKNFDQILNQQAGQSDEEPKLKKSTNKVKHESHTQKPHKVDRQTKVEKSSDIEVEQVERDIVDKVTEVLGITKEELEAMLESLNMTILDLLIPENLNMFLMSFYGVEDPMELLQLADVSEIKTLKAELSEVMTKYDIDVEDLGNLKEMKEAVIALESQKAEQTSENQVPLTEDGETGPEEEVPEGPEVEITDQRTHSEQVADTSTEQVKIDGESQQVTMETPVVTKVEVVNQGAVQEVVTVRVSPEDIMQQIVSSVKVNLTDDSSNMLIQLRPEHLGKLALSISTEQGVITANFMAENPAVKELIEANLAQLKMSLQDQGIQVDKLEVVVTDNQLTGNKDSNQQFGTNQEKKKRAARMMAVGDYGSEGEITDEIVEDSPEHLNLEQNHSVDYSV